MRKNQKGFTLVELIIAVAILAVVTLAVCGFIVVGSRSYTSANTDIMLQQEAQLALNQISDVIIDTTDSINYSGKTATASEMQSVLKDSEFNGEPTEKYLAVVNTNDTTSNNKNPSYWFYWSKDDEIIYFNEVNVDSSMSQSDIEAGFNNAATDKAILAQHVKELHIDISQFEENRVVMISMTFQNGNKEYTTSNNVTVRNRVAINKIDIEPMKKAQEFTITTVKNVILEPGDTYSLPFTVESNATDPGAKDVRWEMVDGSQNGSSISAEGRLTIGREETRESFFVKVVRVNEEYANQNSKVAKTVKVRIKRVNTVNLSCAETTIKAGSTVTVSGSAVGYLLGSNCNGEGCITDDVTKDHDLVSTIGNTGWRIVGDCPATIESADSKEAKIKILSTAKKDAEIVIEARAILPEPDKKNYGPVTGRLVLKVTEGTNGAKFIGSELKFGTDNDPGIFDHMRQSLKTDHGQYIFCIRVREAGTGNCKNDQVMVYFTVGANERFSPDAFGLDLTKSYEVYFQVLDARPKGSTQEATKEMVEAEYRNPNNLDDNGKYIGNMFEADEYYYGLLNPPLVSVEVDNQIYPNEEKDRYIHRSLNKYGPGNSMVGGIYAAGDDDVINIWRNAILNNLEYTLYKEDADGNWKRIYGVDFDTQDYPSGSEHKGTTRIGNLNLNYSESVVDGNTIRNYTTEYNYTTADAVDNKYGCIAFERRGSSITMKRENGDMELASGTYHIVPGFVYANDPHMRQGYYEGDNIIIKDVNKDYDVYYYKQWDSVINVKIDVDLFNIELPEVNGEKRKSFFPTPKDRAFPFDLRSESEQSVYYSFTQYNENNENRGTLGDGNVIVSCIYNAADDKYIITLKDVKINGKQIKTHIYGVYTYDAQGEKWDRNKGEYDIAEITETNLTFSKNGDTYDTYFPTPLKGDFPFRSDVSGDQVRERWQFIVFKRGDGSTAIEKYTVKCTYENDVYSIQLITTERTNTHKYYTYNYGTFTCGRNGTEWDYQSGTGGVEEGTDLKLNVVVTVNGQKYDSFFPAPTDGSFPSSGSKYTLQMYNQGDLEGTSLREQEVTVVYSNGELEFRKEEREPWPPKKWKITGYGKYQYNASIGQWVPVLGYQPGVHYEARWDTLAYFKIGDVEYKAEIPQPGQSGLPTLNGEKEQKDLTYYAIDDSPNGNNYGQNSRQVSWDGVTLYWQYTVDSENVYRLVLLKKTESWDGGYKVEYTPWLKLRYYPDEKAWKQGE